MKKQKRVVRIIYNKDKFTYSKPLMRDTKGLNVYQTFFKFLKFMCLLELQFKLFLPKIARLSKMA